MSLAMPAHCFILWIASSDSSVPAAYISSMQLFETALKPVPFKFFSSAYMTYYLELTEI